MAAVLPLARLRALRPHTSPQLVVVGFAAAVLVGTLLLLLPVARSGPGGAPLLVALFTATSAVCVTGLIVVDTPTYWSGLGQGVILALIQIGGFGIMAGASLLGLVVSRRLGLRLRLTAQAETKTLELGSVSEVLRRVARYTVAFEAVAALLLTARFWLAYEDSLGRAAYLGVFHAVSAFNNAGFALFTDNLIPFATDPWVLLPIAFTVIVGGLGFPVLIELRRELLIPKWWSVHTRITLVTTALLLVAGTVAVTALEWGNPETLGGYGWPRRLLGGFFAAVMPRTAGFNSIDYAVADPATLLVTNVLMFIGGGSASTAGGIKVTTFALLGIMMVAEARGEPTVNVFQRRLPGPVQRQALTVALLGVGVVVSAAIVLLATTRFPLDAVLFEVISAFGTVGLSTGITAAFPESGQLVLVALMFAGRLGPITLAAALALRERALHYRLPEERPIVG